MKNLLKGFFSVFNLFPKTDYMSMVPKEGELLDKAANDVNESFNQVYNELAKEYGYQEKIKSPKP